MKEPQVGDVYTIPYRNQIGKEDERYRHIFVINKLNKDYSIGCCFVGLLLDGGIIIPTQKVKSTIGLDFLKNIYNYLGVLDKKDAQYYGKLAPRYKRLFGIYFIKDKGGKT